MSNKYLIHFVFVFLNWKKIEYSTQDKIYLNFVEPGQRKAMQQTLLCS